MTQVNLCPPRPERDESITPLVAELEVAGREVSYQIQFGHEPMSLKQAEDTIAEAGPVCRGMGEFNPAGAVKVLMLPRELAWERPASEARH